MSELCVVETARGVETWVSAEEADDTVAFLGSLRGFEVRYRWEAVQSIVSLHRTGEDRALVAWLMPVV